MRTRLWPIPLIAVIAAVAAGVVVPMLDQRIDGSLPPLLAQLLFDGDSGAARTVLDAIASSLVTVTSLTFSLTVVTLQLASSQFSPRLLRTFTSDGFVQNTLGLFLATFVYALTVLRGIRSSSDGGVSFVPRMAVSLAFLLALCSVLGLVLFLAHLARQIRVETMLRDVHRNALTNLRAYLPRVEEPIPSWPPPLPRPVGACPVPARGSGFVVKLDERALCRIAVEGDVVVEVDAHPGSFVVEGLPVGHVWPLPDRDVDDDSLAEVAKRMSGQLRTGFERTATQDIGYGLRQLTDVANKALSPGINDPTTAVHALGHISVLLGELAAHRLGDSVQRDDRGRVRVLVHRPDLAQLMEQSLTQPRRYGAADAMVVNRLFGVLVELSAQVRPDQAACVRDHLDRLRATVAEQDFDPGEQAVFRDLAEQVLGNLRTIGGPATA
ncbi:MAG: DUF2254 domain-containing protein [Nocardioidaceae bacterium]